MDERIAKDDREGVGHEIIAGLTLLAFEVEARFNFLGAQLVTDWKERAPAMEKVENVCAHLRVEADFSVRPYLSVARLKNFRDLLAHGKPQDIFLDEEVVVETTEELEAMRILLTDWEVFIDHAFLHEAYSDVEQIWKELMDKSGLKVFDTLTHGGSHISFIEHVEEG